MITRTGRTLTVKDLRKLLEKVPDDAIVQAEANDGVDANNQRGAGCDAVGIELLEYGDTDKELWCLTVCVKHPTLPEWLRINPSSIRRPR